MTGAEDVGVRDVGFGVSVLLGLEGLGVVV